MTSTLVTEFNALERKPLAPSGLVTNCWHISVRHVDLNPPGDLIMLFNPAAHFIHHEGPFQLSQSDTTARATHIAPVILRAFISGMGNPDKAAPKFGPWTLSTNDADLARELELAFVEIGVADALRKVSVASAADNKSADGSWEEFYSELKIMINNADM